MVRYEIDNGGPIHIAYGNDHATGIFLSVYDRRLEYQQGASDEINKLLTKVSADGGDDGSYLELHTGICGLGKRVSKETMAVFMRRYGVPNEHIQEFTKEESIVPPTSTSTSSIFADQEEAEIEFAKFDPNKCCILCGKEASSRCVKCKNVGQEVLYCSKECQKKDWPNHKHFCALLYPEKKVKPIRLFRSSIHAILLEANSTKPKILEVPTEMILRSGEVLWKVCYEAIFPRGTSTSFSHMQFDPLKGNRLLGNELSIQYRDMFLSDGSAPNKCVKAITGNEFHHPWAGPILIIKHRGSCINTDYMDIGLADGGNIIDFFKSYGYGSSD